LTGIAVDVALRVTTQVRGGNRALWLGVAGVHFGEHIVGGNRRAALNAFL